MTTEDKASCGGLNNHLLLSHTLAAEDAQIAIDLFLAAAGRLGGIVRQLHRRSPIGRGDLANEADGIERIQSARMRAAEVVRRHGAPAKALADAAAEALMEVDHQIDFQAVAEHRALLARILAAHGVPGDDFLASG